MSMPSVLLVTQDLQRAGAQRQCVELALGLKRRQGWRVAVAALEPEGPLSRELDDAGVPLFACRRRWRWDISPVAKLARLTRREEFDVVHSFMFLPNFYVRMARLLRRPRLVISSHRSTGMRGSMRYAGEILLSPLCDVLIANSEAGREHLIAHGTSAKRVLVVRNGLDLSPFKATPASVAAAAHPPGGCRIGMVAQMEARKDHLNLVEAMSLVLRKEPTARLILAGDGSRRAQVEEYIRRAGLSNAVELLGTVDGPERLYRTLDIYVQSSAFGEGTSNSIIEAMASGCPVVATDVGGNREVVVGGETGLLVPAGDPGALAGAILSLMEDPAGARRMGAAGAARAVRVYSREAMISATVAIYESFLGRRPHSRDRGSEPAMDRG